MPVIQIFQSDQIDSIGWDEGDILHVQFKKGGLYCYQNVPEGVFELFCRANACNEEQGLNKISIGKLFHFLVKIHKEKYPYKKVHP